MFGGAATRRKPQGRSKSVLLPPPVGGWNAFDPTPEVSALKTANTQPEAIKLENWVVDVGGIKTRPGFTVWATGIPGSYIETLMEYAPPTGSNKLFAACPTGVYDVSAAGAGVLSTTGLTGGRLQHTMMATSGGNFLCVVNGGTYHTYDGSSWTDQDANVTGVSSNTFANIAIHQNRLWFVQDNTLDAWYLGTSAIIGAATKFPLGPLCRLGGELLAIATWSRDGGAGMDDLFVAVTSKGEAIVYAGTNPASAADWRLQGVYRIPEPVGRRCFTKAGADLAVITSLGVVPLSAVLQSASTGVQAISFTNKISGAFKEAYLNVGTAHGWQIVEYPRANLVFVNVPIAERTTQHQFVNNTFTGAWSKFTGLNAGCWGIFGDDLYFGGNDGSVYLFDNDATTDDGDSIVALYQSAFTNFNNPMQKKFNLVRPYFISPSDFTPRIFILTDYDTDTSSVTATVTGGESGTPWGSPWGSPWGAGDTEPVLPWEGLDSGVGVVMSVAFSVSASVAVTFNGCDVVFEVGGLL
jgi:hypothetical protein